MQVVIIKNAHDFLKITKEASDNFLNFKFKNVFDSLYY